ncbi:hypothetical protein KHQ81_03105 [Mycoplasmatota bacterium]|nr:hypothetical protein KHQ81_03105 [Mycoplasmatota bacterium]
MKKLVMTFMLMISLLIISGCSGGSYKITVGNLDTTSNSIQGSYKTFDGNYFKTVKLEEGDVIHFHFRETTKKGTIKAKLLLNDKVITMIEDDSEVTIDKKGSYKVKVYADNHGGTFTVSWDIN